MVRGKKAVYERNLREVYNENNVGTTAGPSFLVTMQLFLYTHNWIRTNQGGGGAKIWRAHGRKYLTKGPAPGCPWICLVETFVDVGVSLYRGLSLPPRWLLFGFFLCTLSLPYYQLIVLGSGLSVFIDVLQAFYCIVLCSFANVCFRLWEHSWSN
jgi:hypothetical protein